MAIATLEEIKTLLQITDTTKDTLITALIPIVENDIFEYLNNYFDDYEDYPAALKVYVANMVNFRIQKPKDGISSESISRYSVSYNIDGEGGYPASITRGLNKWRKVKW